MNGPIETPQQAARRLAASAIRDGYLPEALHEYTAPDGTPLHWRIRLKHPETGDKWIRPMRLNGSGFELGEPEYPAGKPLYRLHELAARPEQTVWLVEGEWCADKLAALRALATTGGAADSAPKADWRPMAGRCATIWPDNDEAGRRYAQEVTEKLLAQGCTVRVIDVEKLGLPKKGDAVDWLEVHPAATAADVAALPCASSEEEVCEVVHRCLFDIEPKPIRWLWPGRIARGKVTIVAGHPDLGKSQLTASMAAVVTTGGAWPVDRTKCERGKVIICSAEDTPEDTIRPRFEAAGVYLKQVEILDAIREPNKDGTLAERPFNLGTDIDRLNALARKLGDVALIVIDPITAYLGGVDSHKNAEVRAVLAPLAAMAAESGAAIVCVSHLNKAGGSEALLRVMGSLGFVAAARGAYLVAKDPEDETRRLFLPMKNNLAKDRGGLSYRVKGKTLDGGIETSCVEWDADPVTMTADEAMAPAVAPDPDAESTAKAEAEDWLRETLKGGDSMDGKRLKRLASDSGIKERTLYRASEAIGVVTLSGGFGKPRRWHLCPPPGKGCHVCQDPEDQ